MAGQNAASQADEFGSGENRFTVAGHKLCLLHRADERLHTLHQMIDCAQERIRLFTYIFHDDNTGQEIMDALVRACRRGVQVQLIVDGFGSGNTDDDFFAPLRVAGGHFHRFGSRWGLSYLIRNHQKIFIADDRHILIGGFNIADDYFDRAGDESWEDFGAIISGPDVVRIAEYYDALCDLSRDGKTAFLKLRRIINEWKTGNGPMVWLLGGPTNRISPWARALKNDLEKARKVDLVAAYFSPSQTILRRLARASKDCGDGDGVRMILAGKSDNGATIGAARLLYKYLLKRGVSIFEYQPRRLHTKLLVIDDACYIGSANLDIRSLFINMEIMLRVEDAALAIRARQIVDEMTRHSIRQTLAHHRKRANWWRRTKWTLAYFLVNTVDYTIGRRIKFTLLRK